MFQFDERDGKSVWAWLPGRAAPQIRVICSMIPGTTAHKGITVRTPAPHIISVTPLAKSSRQVQQEQISRATFSEHQGPYAQCGVTLIPVLKI